MGRVDKAMVKVWFRRNRKARIWCLIKFDNLQYYCQFEFVYLWLKRNKRNKRIRLNFYNITRISSFSFPKEFPKAYKNCYGKGMYLEGKVLYVHEIIQVILKTFKIKAGGWRW